MSDGPEPCWPVWAHDSRRAWRLADARPLNIIRNSYLNDGEAYRVRLIDSQLGFFRLADCVVLKRAGLLGWRPGYVGTYLRVRPLFKFERQLSFSQAQSYVCDFFARQPEAIGPEMTFDDVKASVLAAETPEQLFAAAT